MTKGLRNSLIAVGVVFGFVVVVVFAVVADQFVRAQEYRVFLDQAEAAEDSMELFNSRESQIWADAPESELEWENNWRDYASAGYDGATSLAVTYADMEQAAVLPWHGDLKTAQADYLEHIEAWRERMQSVFEFGSRPEGDPPTRNTIDISSTWRIAQKSSENALPWLFANQLRERQADIFDD